MFSAFHIATSPLSSSTVWANSSGESFSIAPDQRSKSARRLRKVWRGFGFSSSLSINSRAARVSETFFARPWACDEGERRFAKTPARQVNDALESEVVVGLVRNAKVGERIADFGALIEPRAAEHAIGHADFEEPLLELAHLERGAHQNGHVGERDALSLRRLDLIADRAGLLRDRPRRRRRPAPPPFRRR